MRSYCDYSFEAIVQLDGLPMDYIMMMSVSVATIAFVFSLLLLIFAANISSIRAVQSNNNAFYINEDKTM